MAGEANVARRRARREASPIAERMTDDVQPVGIAESDLAVDNKKGKETCGLPLPGACTMVGPHGG